MAERTIHIGTVTAVNPARRELRVTVVKGRTREFEAPEWLRVVRRDGHEARCRVARTRHSGNSAIVALAPGVTRDSVAEMKGAAIVVRENEQRPRNAAEFDLDELVGLSVRALDGTEIGTIVVAYETKANGVIEIEKKSGGTLLLPAIESVIDDIDWDGRAMVVRDIAPYAVDEDQEDLDRPSSTTNESDSR